MRSPLKKNKRLSAGFTLVELLIVVAVVGVLATADHGPAFWGRPTMQTDFSGFCKHGPLSNDGTQFTVAASAVIASGVPANTANRALVDQWTRELLN